MEKFFIEIMERLEKDLAANEGVTPVLTKVCLDIERVEAAIKELFANADFYTGYSLNNEHAILFNKKYFPSLLAKLFFAHLQFEFENQKQCSTQQIFRDWCARELEKVKAFFAWNSYFYMYLHTHQTELDKPLFVGDGKGYTMILTPTPLQTPQDLSTIAIREFYNAGLRALASLIAYEEYRKILKEELDDNRPAVMEMEEVRNSRVEWSKNITDLAEQILGQYEYRTTLVDGKPATQEFLIEEACRLYSNVTFKQLTAAIRGVTARSKGPAVHHQSLIMAMQRRHDRLL